VIKINVRCVFKYRSYIDLERSKQGISVSCHEAFKQKTNSLSRTTNDVVTVLAVFQVSR